MKRGIALILAATLMFAAAAPAGASQVTTQKAKPASTGQTKQANLPDGFSLPEDDSVASVNLFNLKQQAFVDAKSTLSELNRLLQASEPTARTGPVKGPVSDVANRLEVTLNSDVKYTYEFYAQGVKLSKSKPGADAGTPTFYGMSPTACKELAALLYKTYREEPKGAAWLGLMRESKASNMNIYGNGGYVDYGVKDASFHLVFMLLKGIEIDPESSKKELESTQAAGQVDIDLEFSNGIQYTIYLSEDTLRIESSDMQSALTYRRVGGTAPCAFIDFVKLDGRFVPNTGKPVIYLYPQKATDVSVKVRYKGEFVYTYPAYNGGWNVTAYPDGRLVNKPDGTEHFYLFWDGYKPVDWKFDEGFCVSGADTEKFLREKLAYMGLSPREYNDFIVFWLPEMQQNPYNLITFSTEQYEAIAPLEISPKPDSLLRVHMVFKSVDKPVSIPAQKLERFERKGFTAVEWGGSRA